MGKLNVAGTEIQDLQIEEDDYISLTCNSSSRLNLKYSAVL